MVGTHNDGVGTGLGGRVGSGIESVGKGANVGGTVTVGISGCCSLGDEPAVGLEVMLGEGVEEGSGLGDLVTGGWMDSVGPNEGVDD